MIIELVGPMAAGKSSLAPLIAEELLLPHYGGQAFHRLDGSQLTKAQLLFDRVGAVLTNHRLFVGSLRQTRTCTTRLRVNFALNVCGRDRFARRVALRGGGVIESGPLHALCQMAAHSHTRLSDLASVVAKPDVYVRLRVPLDELVDRYLKRAADSTFNASEYRGWVERYDDELTRAAKMVSRPVIDINSHQKRNDVTADVVAAVGRARLESLDEQPRGNRSAGPGRGRARR